MSHNAERKEKNCLNCNAEVHGRFCHVCGQENTETKESFWSLARHFIYDILHFDGKFFHTIKYIFIRPGFVARQYAEGKRATYLHPIRMYLFTSAVFFLVFFSVNKIHINTTPKENADTDERLAMATSLQKQLIRKPGDSILQQRIQLLKDTTKTLSRDSIVRWTKPFSLSIGNSGSYTSLREYDSVQNILPQKDRDGWFVRRMAMQVFKLSTKYRNPEEGVLTFSDVILHQVPYLLFVSLPFFALLLKLLYIRRKNFYYSDHAVFTLYHYILSFILLLLIYSVNALQNWSGWGIFGFLIVLLGLSWPVYLYISMKNFYRQSGLKTFGKFMALNFLGFILMCLLFMLFLILSLFKL